MSRYDIYISGKGDDMTAVIRDNERLARYLQNGDLDYTWTRYHLNKKQVDELRMKYADNTTYYN